MTLVTARLIQPETATSWCASQAICPAQTAVAVSKPESHKGLSGMDYRLGLNSYLGLFIEDNKEVRFT